MQRFVSWDMTTTFKKMIFAVVFIHVFLFVCLFMLFTVCQNISVDDLIILLN
jgi:hypothetical protein